VNDYNSRLSWVLAGMFRKVSGNWLLDWALSQKAAPKED
jgi:hypothetical protein